MSISILLRLAPAAVASRRLAGEVEIVATGERALIGSADDLIALLNDAAPAEPDCRQRPHAPTAPQESEKA